MRLRNFALRSGTKPCYGGRGVIRDRRPFLGGETKRGVGRAKCRFCALTGPHSSRPLLHGDFDLGGRMVVLWRCCFRLRQGISSVLRRVILDASILDRLSVVSINTTKAQMNDSSTINHCTLLAKKNVENGCVIKTGKNTTFHNDFWLVEYLQSEREV